jgi:hypothetical protein
MSKEAFRAVTAAKRKSASDIDIMADAPEASAPNIQNVSQGEARPSDGMAPPPEARRQINYRPTIATAERLRLIAFQQRRSVQELVDEAVLLWLADKR